MDILPSQAVGRAVVEKVLALTGAECATLAADGSLRSFSPAGLLHRVITDTQHHTHLTTTGLPSLGSGFPHSIARQSPSFFSLHQGHWHCSCMLQLVPHPPTGGGRMRATEEKRSPPLFSSFLCSPRSVGLVFFPQPPPMHKIHPTFLTFSVEQ